MTEGEADAWEPRPTSIDAAYERRAVASGLNGSPIHLENIAFLKYLTQREKSLSGTVNILVLAHTKQELFDWARNTTGKLYVTTARLKIEDTLFFLRTDGECNDDPWLYGMRFDAILRVGKPSSHVLSRIRK